MVRCASNNSNSRAVLSDLSRFLFLAVNARGYKRLSNPTSSLQLFVPASHRKAVRPLLAELLLCRGGLHGRGDGMDGTLDKIPTLAPMFMLPVSHPAVSHTPSYGPMGRCPRAVISRLSHRIVPCRGHSDAFAFRWSFTSSSGRLPAFHRHGLPLAEAWLFPSIRRGLGMHQEFSSLCPVLLQLPSSPDHGPTPAKAVHGYSALHHAANRATP